jgi:hypothetical protein
MPANFWRPGLAPAVLLSGLTVIESVEIEQQRADNNLTDEDGASTSGCSCETGTCIVGECECILASLVGGA